jgi:hypothetical protein
MSHRRTTNRATRLFTLVVLITLLPLAAACPVHADGTWTNQALAAGPSTRERHAMASLGGGHVLLFGGYDAAGWHSETWVYDLSTNTWTNQVPAAGPSARGYHAMAYLGGDRALLFGGHDGVYDGETWLATGFYSGIRHRTYRPLVAK